MSKIAFIGEKKLSLIFKNFDVDTFIVKEGLETLKKIEEIVKMDYSIILVTEEYSENLKEFLLKRTETVPVIFVLPSIYYSGFGVNLISSVIEKAVGIKILSKEKK
jgi:vacuolar-type H+-ATPase subunit F/Vma7